METAESGRRAATLFGAAALCAAIYFVDILCVRLSDTSAAAFTVNVALPLDLMAVAPLAFWLAYVRTHKKSPILVLPVIYLGGLASAAMSIDGQFTLVPYLLVAAAAVDFAVLGLELPRIIRIIKTLNDEAKNDGCPPSKRFRFCTEGVLGNSAPARMVAMELTMWWYLFRSWGKQAHCPEGCTAFSYHRESNAAALTAMLVFLAVVEATVVHIALLKVSGALAIVATLATVYALAWLVANTRAMALAPILVNDSSVLVRWGFLLAIRFNLSNVEEVVLGDFDAPKSKRVDLSSLGGSPCWVILKEPVGYRPLVGKARMVRYIKVSPDDMVAFRNALLD